jgi:phosphate transport system protein
MMMTKRVEFDHGLDELKELLVEMGGRVEKALADSIAALQAIDVVKAKSIIREDPEINKLEERITEIGSKLIATQQPVAKDLRRILVAFRISNDLERMADLAVDIAKVVIRFEGQSLVKPLVDIPRMAEICQTMTYESIQAFVQENVDLAYKMAKDDDIVDALYSQILMDMFALMMEDPKNANQAMNLSFVGRYIERIGDHATNIGESVVYLVTGIRPDLNV